MDQLWDDDLYEEPSEAYKQRKTLTGHTAVSKQTAAPPVSSAKLFATSSAQVVSRTSLPQVHGVTHMDRESDIQRFKELHHTVERAEEELRSRGEALAVLTTRAQKSQQLVAQIQVFPVCHCMHVVSDVTVLCTSLLSGLSAGNMQRGVLCRLKSYILSRSSSSLVWSNQSHWRVCRWLRRP